MTTTNTTTTTNSNALKLADRSPKQVRVTLEDLRECRGNRSAASALVSRIRADVGLHRHSAPVVVSFEGTDVYLVLRTWDEMSFQDTETEVAFWRMPYSDSATLTVNVLTDIFASETNIQALANVHAVECVLRRMFGGKLGIGINVGAVTGKRTATEHAVYVVADATVSFHETSWYTRYEACRSGEASYSGRKTKTVASARKLYRAVASGKLAQVKSSAELEAYCAANRIALEHFHSVWR